MGTQHSLERMKSNSWVKSKEGYENENCELMPLICAVEIVEWKWKDLYGLLENSGVRFKDQ